MHVLAEYGCVPVGTFSFILFVIYIITGALTMGYDDYCHTCATCEIMVPMTMTTATTSPATSTTPQGDNVRRSRGKSPTSFTVTTDVYHDHHSPIPPQGHDDDICQSPSKSSLPPSPLTTMMTMTSTGT